MTERVVGVTISTGRGYQPNGTWGWLNAERLSVTIDCEEGREDKFDTARRAVVFSAIREVLGREVIAHDDNGCI